MTRREDLTMPRDAARSFTDTAQRWLLPGAIAGVVFRAVAMVTGALTTTAWAMAEGIGQAVEVPAPHDYHFAPVPQELVGVLVHSVVPMGLGVSFAAGLLRLGEPEELSALRDHPVALP